jgi:hypothetical protein
MVAVAICQNFTIEQAIAEALTHLDLEAIRNCLKRLGRGQSPGHEATHRRIHHGFAGLA